MSVISFKEIHNGRDGEDSVGSDGKRITRYTRVFRAVTDSNMDDADTVGAHDDCPKLLDAYPQNIWATCRRVRPRNESFSKRVWLVTCVYSTAAFSSDELDPIENPLNERAKFAWTTEQYQRPFIQHVAGPNAGLPITNTAYDPFLDPMVEGDDSRLIVTVRKNVIQIPDLVLSFRNTINNRPFVVDGLAVGTRMAKLSGMALGEAQERNGVSFHVFSFTMQLDEDTWIKKVLNDGFETRDGKPCLDKNGHKLTDPGMLKADGTQLPYPINPANITFINCYIYKEKDFNLLPLS